MSARGSRIVIVLRMRSHVAFVRVLLSAMLTVSYAKAGSHRSESLYRDRKHKRQSKQIVANAELHCELF